MCGATLLGLAGTVCSLGAAPETTVSQDLFPVHRIGHLYINLKTGERVMTPYGRRAGPDIWNNDDNAVCGNFFYGVDRPTRSTTDPRPQFGGSVNSIGDVRDTPGEGTLIDGLGFGTASVGIKSTDTTRHKCVGFDLFVLFYESDNANGEVPDPRANFVHSVTVADLPAEEGSGNAWAFTVDLVDNDFTIGNHDLDGDGFLDFGWGMSFRQGQRLTNGINSAKGICGPYLVAPAGFVNELGVASTSTSRGVPNRIHWYGSLTFDSSGNPQDRSHQSFIRSYNFGVPSSTNPYASLYLTLAAPCVACYSDFNGDCFVDFMDFDDFVYAFEAGDPSADFNQDGFLDFMDFDEAVASFEAGCG